MLPRIRRYCVIVLLAVTGCNAISPIVQAPAPTLPADGLAEYMPALIASHQGDLARLDRPTRYSLTLRYDPATPTLSGSEQVQYFNRQSVPLNEIYFRLFANYPQSGGKITVSRLLVDGVATTPAYEVQETALRVPLDNPLLPGASTDVFLDFTVTIPRVSGQHYDDFLATAAVTTLPTVYPLIPAYDSNGWHIEIPPPYGDLVYANVSLFSVTMTVPSAVQVIASGSTASTTDNHDGTTTWHLVGAPMRDFDLNVSAQLQKVSAVVGETEVNSWYEPSDSDSGNKALKFATDSLKVFQNRFGTYPYRELDVIETPTTAGGIEYPGIVAISRSLYKGGRGAEFFEFATVHEVSHQWWYGMVGDDQVNQPWVDESLAQYSALLYEEDLRGKDSARLVLRNYFMSQYDRAKNAGHDLPVNLPVSAYSDSDYGAIVYGKGPLFYDAIRRRMGDANFFQFLRTYFDRYRYRVATGDDILRTAEETCSCDLQNEYKEWIAGPQQ